MQCFKRVISDLRRLLEPLLCDYFNRTLQHQRFQVLIDLSHVSVMDYDIPKTVEQCRAKLREKFEENRNVKDIRVIDALVIKVRHLVRE